MAQNDRTTGLVGNAAIKVPCRAATTANITLAGEQTIDGVACVTDDRVLVKNQTSGVDDGIWVVDTGAWNRASDFDGAYDIVKGTLVPVTDGTANAGSYWRVTTANPITIGTSSITLTLATGSVLGLGTAAVKNIGTSGDTVPVCNGANTWANAQTFTVAPVFTDNVGTIGALGILSRVNTFVAAQQIVKYSDPGVLGPTILMWHNSASPAANDLIGWLNFSANDSAGNLQSYAEVRTFIIDPTSGSEDGNLVFQTTVNGTSSLRFNIFDGLTGAGAVGGDKGPGAANFTACYDDNVLLTCYVFDAAIDGVISNEKWDSKVPERHFPEQYRVEQHEIKDEHGKVTLQPRKKVVREAYVEQRSHQDMRKFRARLGTQHDPLDIDCFTKHWREKRHLSSMPNEEKFDPVKGLPTGSWIQRLIETVEIQAVHIAKLNERLKALEAQRK